MKANVKLAGAGLILAIGLIFQAQWLQGRWGGEAVKWVVDDLQTPAWKRAAEYLEGPRFSEYVEFIRSNTPPEARIILPPRIPERAESNVGLMQFFLFPRDIHNCGINEVEDCVQRIGGPSTYIIALEDFPPRELAALNRRFIAFDAEIGLYGPP